MSGITLSNVKGITAVDDTVGTGTVTSVSVTTANGVSGTVATATTTPAISLTLGAITPSSVASTGTSSATSYAPTGGSVTGNQFWLPAANTPGISANGVEVVRFATAASGVNYLQITPAAAAGQPTISAQGSDSNINISFSPKGAGGVVTTSNFQANGGTFTGSVTGTRFVPSASTVATNGMYLPSANTLGFSTNSTLRLNISSTGIHTMSAYGAGAATFDASGVISSVSDERLKNIVGDFTATVETIKPILYQWKNEPHDTVGVYAGFSAQNVQSAFPEGCGINPDGYLTLQDRAVLAAAINTINKQGEEIKSLRGEIEKMKDARV